MISRIDRGKQKASETASSIGRRASETWRATRQSAQSTGQRVRQSASSAANQLQHGGRSFFQRSRQTISDHPFAVVGTILGIGALIGILLPRSRRENQWFGEEAESARHTVQEAGHEAYERGKHVAEEAYHSARDTAREEGLTAQGLKKKAQHIAEEATDTARREARHESEQMRRESE